MNTYLLELINKYRGRGILLDTNILLLYIVGTFDQRLVSAFSRTSNFSQNDFIILLGLLNSFETKITTPHILTEVSNLLGNRRDLHNSLKAYLRMVREIFSEGIKLGENNSFVNFGITDIATLDVCKDSFLVVTDDRPLYGLLVNKGVGTISFDQLRTALL